MRSRRLRATVVVLLAAAALWLLRRGEASDEAARGPAASTGRLAVHAAASNSRPLSGAIEPPPPRETARDSGALTEIAAPDAGQDARLRTFLRDNALAAEQQVDSFCVETRRLGAARPPAKHSRDHDAAVYLGGRVDWEDGRVGLLHLPATVLQRLGDPARSWQSVGPADYAGLDFSWFAELAAFDHWSLLGDGPLRDAQRVDFWSAPLPGFVALQNWATLRLIKGLHENDLERASREVRHLAELIGSTGVFMGEVTRLKLLRIERSAWDQAEKPPSDPPPNEDELARELMTVFAGTYFLFPGVAPAVREKALACMPTPCPAIVEALGAATGLRKADPTAEETLAWLAARPGCDSALLRRLAEETRSEPEDLLGPHAGVASWMSALIAGRAPEWW